MTEQPQPRRFRDRTTGDVLVLMVAGTVCTTVIGTAITIMVIEVVQPNSNTETAIRQVTGIINTLIGLLAGFLAGRTDSTINAKRDEPPNA